MDKEFEQFVKREKIYRRKVLIIGVLLMSLGAFFIHINWTIMGSFPLIVGVLFLIGLLHNGASKEAYLKQKGLDEKPIQQTANSLQTQNAVGVKLETVFVTTEVAMNVKMETAQYSQVSTKIYTIDEIHKIYIEEYNKIKNIQKKHLFNYQEKPQIEAVESDFYKRIAKIRRIKVEVTNIIKTEIKYSELSPPLQLNNNKQLSLNFKSNLPVYIVSFDSEKINDWCQKNTRVFPFLKIESLYYDEPKFFRGQKKIIDINFSTTGSYRIRFYEYIDTKYLSK